MKWLELEQRARAASISLPSILPVMFDPATILLFGWDGGKILRNQFWMIIGSALKQKISFRRCAAIARKALSAMAAAVKQRISSAAP